jgi:precorrin-2 dehydrogenase / sirohydrochlorin ferrochelatase
MPVNYYPVLLNLKGRRCVVLGGGLIAEGKVHGLLEAGANVTVVSPALTQVLQTLADESRIVYLPRAYEPGDLADAFIAISATNDRTANALVWREGIERNIPVNVVDDTPHCNFIAPSILRRGDLIVTVSTSGRAPALAVRLREKIATLVGDEHVRFLELAGTLREPLAARYPDFETRRALWYKLVDSDVLELLGQGDEAAARQRIIEIMGVAPAG